jgi:transcriptional regulator of acetoin/glycerol metabolism
MTARPPILAPTGPSTGTSARPHHDHEAAVAAALAQGSAARSAIVASWRRSSKVHGLDPSRRVTRDRLTEAEFRTLCERLGPLLKAAGPTLDRLFQAVGGLGGCVILASDQGVPVDRRGKAAHDRDFMDNGLWTGTLWSEAVAGTNGIGTCLAEGRAVTIHRDQHYLSANIDLSCSSAPVHDAMGQMVAVLDVSTAGSETSEAVAGLISHAVMDAARRIEGDLFRIAFPKARLMMAPGPDRAQGAILAVDGDELVIGATRAARQHFGLIGDLARKPVPAADLLGLDTPATLQDGERAVLARALARAAGNASAAARALGISRATFHRKLGRKD